MKAALLNSALTLVSLLVGLAICEAGLRMTGVMPGNPFERLINHYDSYVGYRMIPGMHETVPGVDSSYQVDIVSLGFEDDAGFRDDGITPPVSSVFIGDSFVWGYGVELADSVSKQFERLTGKDSVNLGMTAFTGPTQYSRLLAKYGVKLRPRYAFIGVFLGNDFGDEANFAAWEASGTRKSYPEWMTDKVKGYSPDTLPYKVRRFLYQHSALARLLSDRVNFGFNDAPAAPDDNIVYVKTDQLAMYLDKRALAGSTEESDLQQVALVRAALEDIKSTATKSSIQPIVFIIPTKEMVYQQLFPEPRLKEMTDWHYTVLLQLLNSSGITFVDLLPVLQTAAARGEQLYFAQDIHWNARGHAVAAAAIRDFMVASSGP